MIRWFTQNGVAANLLAGITIITGIFAAMNIKLELFPELDLDIVSITVPSPALPPKKSKAASSS